jgi:hypothetical protein
MGPILIPFKFNLITYDASRVIPRGSGLHPDWRPCMDPVRIYTNVKYRDLANNDHYKNSAAVGGIWAN